MVGRSGQESFSQGIKRQMWKGIRGVRKMLQKGLLCSGEVPGMVVPSFKYCSEEVCG